MRKLFSRNFKETVEVTLIVWEMAPKNSPHLLEDSKMACFCFPEKTSSALRYATLYIDVTHIKNKDKGPSTPRDQAPKGKKTMGKKGKGKGRKGKKK